ncbi:MAG TPA: T9SS type A sorting domain-containing protein [Ignavibacteriaceae bacterium]|nr:T9SS type A sorting domain-containing protein [Ignavibacteriaceae bacterium]
MNKLVILIMLSFSLNTFAQEILFPETEIIFHTRGATNSTVTTFEVRPLLYDNFYPMAIYSQNKFDRCNLDLKLLPLQSIDLTGNVSCPYSGLEYIFANEDWIGGSSCTNAEYGPFGNSLYEIIIKVNGVNKFRFLLDTRHNSLPNGCSNNCNGNDISIVYNVNINTVGHIDGFWDGISKLDVINNNGYYTWGEIRNNCSSSFSDFNKLNMPILEEPTLQGVSPLLSWIKPQNINNNAFDFYELQRSVNNGNFITIFTSTDINTTSFWDQDIFWNPNLNATKIIYRLFAIFNSNYQDMIIDVSNYKEINTSRDYICKHQNFSGKYYFNLSKNYPNPFNPTTKINFQIPEDGIVELKVYDINGNELKILLNEFISAGEYTLDFNATDLPSGIYFYRIKYKEYVETRQMVLLK